MRYELYLRMPESAERPMLDALLALLNKAEFSNVATLPAELDLGQGKLVVEAYVREETTAQADTGASTSERIDGVNIAFDLAMDAAQGDRAISFALSVADELGANVFDPQIGSLVDRADRARILSTWQQSYEFHSSVAGTAGLGHGGSVDIPEEKAFSTRLKYVLLLGLLLAVGVFVIRTCFGYWIEKNFSVPAPAGPNVPHEADRRP